MLNFTEQDVCGKFQELECQREIVSFIVTDVFLLLDNAVHRFKTVSLQSDPLTLGFPELLNALI